LKSNTFFRKSQYIGLHLKLTRHAASAKIAFKLGVKNDTLVNLMLKKILALFGKNQVEKKHYRKVSVVVLVNVQKGLL